MTFPAGGSLKDQSVTRLLQMIMEEQIDGALTISRGNVSRTIFFKEGMIIYATSTESRDRLGEIFVVQGKLSKSEVSKAFKKARRGNTLLGRILLVEGKITSQELFLAVTAQVVAILERVRSWRKGDFTLGLGEEPEPGTVLLRIPLSLYLGVKTKKSRSAASPVVKETEVPVEVPEEGPSEEKSVEGALEIPGGLVFFEDEEEAAAARDVAPTSFSAFTRKPLRARSTTPTVTWRSSCTRTGTPRGRRRVFRARRRISSGRSARRTTSSARPANRSRSSNPGGPRPLRSAGAFPLRRSPLTEGMRRGSSSTRPRSTYGRPSVSTLAIPTT